MRMKNKKWSVPFISSHEDVVIDINKMGHAEYQEFLHRDQLYLEIGTGKGNFILQMAEKYPDKNFLGVEKSMTCLAITAKKVIAASLSNVRLIACDVAKLFDILPENKFQTIFLNFSDPWPKKRHYKRRLTYGEFLEKYRYLLVDDGTIIMKTDNISLFEFSQSELLEHDFEMEFLSYDYDGSDEFDAPTEYEQYFREEGIHINRLIAKKGDKLCV